ncbi:hypothetical protein FRC09_017619 [Ceratobasidium sp. 395]|nr:hypothetical protein FRC09_017619 [Ceratobasidium sp. 395]
MAKTLPNLKDLLVAFFQGALETWERFTSEYPPDGVIANASVEQRSCVFNSATNKVSERALGRARQQLKNQPALMDKQCNGRVIWTQNNTHQFVQAHFTEDDHKYVIGKACEVDASGENQRVCAEMNSETMKRAEINRERQARTLEKRLANEQRLAGIRVPEGASQAQLEELTVRQLDEQIDKIRENDKEMPAKSKAGNKKAKVQVILDALARCAHLSLDLAGGKGKEMAVGGWMRFEEAEGEFPQDKEMCYPEEVAN